MHLMLIRSLMIFNTYKTLYLKLYDEIDKLIKKDKNITLTFKKNKISIEEFAKNF